MTTVQRSRNILQVGVLIAAMAGSYLAGGATSTPNNLTASPPSECHVGPAAGTYSCTVIVDAAPSASPSAAPSAVATPSAVPPTASPTGAPTPAPTPTVTSCYGPCIGFDTLANTTVQASQPNYYRFRAGQSSPLRTARVYLQGGSGYAGGNGGSYRVTLETCSGGFPTGTVLDTAPSLLVPGNPTTPMWTVSFAGPASLVSGSLYCLRWTNVDANGNANYTSLDGTLSWNSGAQIQPRYPNNDLGWGYGTSSTGGTWHERSQTPILDLGYANGAHEGMGYIEVSYGGDQGTIAGSAQVRERFTPSSSVTISGGGVFAWRASGTSPLTITLETVAGAPVTAAILPSSSFPIPSKIPPNGGQTWVGFTFPIAVTLQAGIAYDLRWSSPGSYGVLPIRSGVKSYGYNSSTTFPDEVAVEKGQPGAWSSLGRVAGENDLPWYLH